MKIGILSPVAWRTPPRHYGPWEQMASNIAEGLVANGQDVTLFATGDSLTAGNLDFVISTGYEEDRNLDAKVVECLHISNIMEKASSFDVIHNHYDFLPLSFSKLISTPMITTVHGFSSPKIIEVYKKYNQSTTYVSISNSNRSPDLKYLATVYNGIQTAEFSFVEFSDDYLLFFGRIHPDKGTLEAIEIAKRSKRRLIIAGIIQDKEYFIDRIEPHFDDQIIFAGSAGPEERKNLLGKAAALLHPINFEEPFGLSVAEAMYCGTPVIAFDRGSMPELISEGVTGFLVKDVGAASDAVSDIKSISRNACHAWAKEKFSSEKMVDDYLELYKQII